MNCFILTKTIKEHNCTKIINVCDTLEKAEKIINDRIELFNENYPEHKIYIRNEIDHPETKLNSEDEIIYCKSIWYRNIDAHTIFKIEEFQIE